MKDFSTRKVLLVMLLTIIVVAELSTAKWFNVIVGSSLLDNAGNDSDNIHLSPEEQETLKWKISIPKNRTEIRRWGCNRTETPFIFVHIGKAGGGSVGARIAASSLNYTQEGHNNKENNAYYPVSGKFKARFMAHGYSRHLPSDDKTFEGTTPCHASTPLGHAIGCPESLKRLRRLHKSRNGECDPYSDTCRLVYKGHNFFGSELHWLPLEYLKNWWASLGNDNAITPLWDKLLPHRTWCSSKNMSRPVSIKQYVQDYEECSIPLQREVDTKAIHALTKQLSTDDSHVITSWSPLYASLPVLRVTVMRDPFTWLVSKYFWHRKEQDIENNSACDNIEEAISKTNPRITRSSSLGMGNSSPGWISRMCLGYIMYLCGEDCIVRYAAGTATLQDVELQAEDNLRQAFAVVGIMEELDTFYEMLTARVQYIDTTLNSNVTGSKHSTGQSKENEYCKTRFREPDLQAKLLELSPELRALHRLYQVAKEVNRFQLAELRECSSK